MTINAPAAVILAMFVANAEDQGVPRARLGGTLQNDILKEYQAQKEFVFPPRPSMRLVRDTITFCTAEMPRWHTISISGYHIREAGSTAVQELAFTLANGFAYVELARAAGLDVDAFAPRLSFFFNAHIDFFEEIAKYRAARRIWARWMRDHYGATDARSTQLRFHTQTAGVSLTAQQPEINIVRTAIEALAGVLGGTQSLHTNSYDETYALPTEAAAQLALRTQQVILEESGVAAVADPLGGSYFVETLTDQVEAAAWAYIEKIDAMGGIVRAVEEGYPQREIAKAAYDFQRQVDTGERGIVGVNKYVSPEDGDGIPTLKIEEHVERDQIARNKAWKAARDASVVASRLAAVRHALAHDDVNVMPPIIDAVRDGVTVGEICDEFRQVLGEHRDPAYL
jgi:methylmalonyl-CoA mutase N-terminal domain/subunit